MYISYTLPYILFFCFTLCVFISSPINLNDRLLGRGIKLQFQYFYLFSILIFLGCRGLVGVDWTNYKSVFDNAPALFDNNNVLSFIKSTQFEKGYVFYNIIIKTISSNYLSLQFISVLLDIIILHYFFKDYCDKYYFLAWAMYFVFSGYMYEIIILRNSKAILLFCLSIKYIEQRKIVKYYLLIFLAMMFHLSAVVYLPLYFLPKMKRNKKIEILLFFMGNVIFLLHISWLKSIFLIIPFSGKLGELVKWYILLGNDGGAFGLSIGYIERFITFMLFYKYIDIILSKNKRLLIFWYLYLIYSGLYFYCSEFYILIERLPNLFVCSYWILYPYIYKELKIQYKKLFIFAFLLYGILKTISLMNYKWAYYENFLLMDNGLMRGKEYYY